MPTSTLSKCIANPRPSRVRLRFVGARQRRDTIDRRVSPAEHRSSHESLSVVCLVADRPGTGLLSLRPVQPDLRNGCSARTPPHPLPGKQRAALPQPSSAIVHRSLRPSLPSPRLRSHSMGPRPSGLALSLQPSSFREATPPPPSHPVNPVNPVQNSPSPLPRTAATSAPNSPASHA